MYSIISYETHYMGQSLKIRPPGNSLDVLDEFFEQFCSVVETTREDIVLIDSLPHRLDDALLFEKCKSGFGAISDRNQFISGEVSFFRNMWNILGHDYDRDYLLSFVSKNYVKTEVGGPLQYGIEKQFVWKNRSFELSSSWDEKFPTLDLNAPSRLEILLSKYSCYANFRFVFPVEFEDEVEMFKNAIRFLAEKLKTNFKERDIRMMVLNKSQTEFKRKPFRF
jgi:hypothetical protein